MRMTSSSQINGGDSWGWLGLLVAKGIFLEPSSGLRHSDGYVLYNASSIQVFKYTIPWCFVYAVYPYAESMHANVQDRFFPGFKQVFQQQGLLILLV